MRRLTSGYSEGGFPCVPRTVSSGNCSDAVCTVRNFTGGRKKSWKREFGKEKSAVAVCACNVSIMGGRNRRSLGDLRTVSLLEEHKLQV